jgi:hypothetical protein
MRPRSLQYFGKTPSYKVLLKFLFCFLMCTGKKRRPVYIRITTQEGVTDMDAASRFTTADSGAGRHDETFAPKAMRPGHLEHTDEGFEGKPPLHAFG